MSVVYEQKFESFFFFPIVQKQVLRGTCKEILLVSSSASTREENKMKKIRKIGLENREKKKRIDQNHEKAKKKKKSVKKLKILEGFVIFPLLTSRAGYATCVSSKFYHVY